MKLILLFLFLIAGCAHKIVQDPFPPSVDTGFKRVETIICGIHSVGENGCVFADGKLDSSLKVFKVLSGEVSIKGCGLDKSYAYSNDEKNLWLDIPLSGKLTGDCVLDIYQKVTFPGEDKATFPIYGMRGTVSLGTCPSNARCDMITQQYMLNVPFGSYIISGDGDYLIQGCKQVVDGPSPIHGAKPIKLDIIWPGGYPKEKTECLFITGIRGTNVQKRYLKINIFQRNAEFLATPEIKPDGDSIEFLGDEYASVVMVDGKVIVDHKGKFTPSPDGNYLRFYTVNGRSLVAFVKNGEVVWTK